MADRARAALMNDRVRPRCRQPSDNHAVGVHVTFERESRDYKFLRRHSRKFNLTATSLVSSFLCPCAAPRIR
jgi:hypothetical protein